MGDRELWASVDIRVIDQRIGQGVGGRDTVIRALHKPTGIIIEMPRLMSSQYHERQLCLEMLEYALAEIAGPNGRPAP